MPATAVKSEVPPGLVDAPERSRPEKSPKNYRGFVAGVFSGIAKLSGAHLLPSFWFHTNSNRSGASLRYHQGPITDDR